MKTGVNYKSVAIFSIAIVTIWVVFIFLTVISALDSSAIRLSKHNKTVISMVYPQSWGFFSKNPREPVWNIYGLDNKQFTKHWPNNSLNNIFGLDRFGRTQGIELGSILGQLPPSEKWHEYNKDTKLNSTEDADFLKVKNVNPSPSLCGKLIITSEELIPWAWSKNTEVKKEIKKYIRIDVKCSLKD
ncbi:SdpA family antimicrobial peptide system protein [Bacillus cereus]|uniref:SdpA family antimicrobial peptide system protein n=1 Tax=Bacillus cereus TaxID=1396 RepID=UPI00187B0A7C|nr:SdpA family antimicrobial peptide system protein [Bacillus cereus]MBE7106613.1 SdpA family antimicrobial peptide system protein [Bacillus cereus]